MVTFIDTAGPGMHRLPMPLEDWLRGGSRLAFACGDVAFEQFAAADTMALYQVRNDPSVRPFMPSPDPLPFERHEEWVRSQLLETHAASPLVLIGRAAGEPVACGLLKPAGEAGTLEIGVLVAGARQRGPLPLLLGVALFTIADHVFGAHTLISHVHRGHRTALRLNQAVGLNPVAGSGKPGETRFRAALASALATPVYRRCARDLVIRVNHPPGE
jgi:RimJ/RimL family protein N-acetyltransferase